MPISAYNYNDHPFLRLREKLQHPLISRKNKAAVNLKTGRFDNINFSCTKLTVLYCLAYTADDDS